MPASVLLGGGRMAPSVLSRPSQQQHRAHARPAPLALRSRPGRALPAPLPPPRAGKGDDRGTTGNGALDDAIKVGGGLVDAAADLVPASVPRPVAKAGVALAGAGLAFWLLQKVVSTVLTLTLLGGGLYFYLTRSGGEGERAAASSSSRGGGGGDDDDDPLAEARRIMSKYTK